jgi:hypothetical protein
MPQVVKLFESLVKFPSGPRRMLHIVPSVFALRLWFLVNACLRPDVEDFFQWFQAALLGEETVHIFTTYAVKLRGVR